MYFTEEAILTILEKAFPDILYKDMKKAIENLKRAGIINKTKNFENSNVYCKGKFYDNKNQPTASEIKEWEKYNGKGSYGDGSSLKGKSKPIPVNNVDTFNSIFDNKTNKDDDEFPF